MKKVAAGIIVGLLLGLLIGYQFAPRTDTGDLEETIDLLLEEVDTSDSILQASEGRVDALEAEWVTLDQLPEFELTGSLKDFLIDIGLYPS